MAAGDTARITERYMAGYTVDEIIAELGLKRSLVVATVRANDVDMVAVERALAGDRTVFESLNSAESIAFSRALGQAWRVATLEERELLLDRGVQLGLDRNQYRDRAERAAARAGG